MNNLMEYKGYYGSVEYSDKDDILFGKVLGINSLISYEGDSIKTLKSDFKNAVDDYLSLCEKKGLTPEKTYKGSFNIRISPEMHKKLARYSFSQQCSINSTVEEAIAEYLADKE